MTKRASSALTSDEDIGPGAPNWRILYPSLKPDGTFRKSEKALEKYAVTFMSPFQPKYEEEQDTLNIVHIVQPAKTWHDLKKYSKFISK